MYVAIVVALMLVLPMTSIGYEFVSASGPAFWPVVGKWFAFWSVGARLFLAGARQSLQPRYTATVILRLKGTESLILVRELGFANVAIGMLGLGSLFLEQWRPAALLVGATFYFLAGVAHAFRRHRGKLENVAMTSDLWAAMVLSLSLLGALAS